MGFKTLPAEQKQLRRRILEISFKKKFSHLGSCLSAVDLINAIYTVKKSNEKFVLSNGHAAVAWYAVLERVGKLKPKAAEELHVHPERNEKYGISASTGSLGHGLPIALGMALSDSKKKVYCMISDGEVAEGSIWESFRIAASYKLENLVVVLNFNGWGAYMQISKASLLKQLRGIDWAITKVDGHDADEIKRALKKKVNKPHLLFAQTSVEQFPFLKGQDAHYYVMKEADFQSALEVLR